VDTEPAFEPHVRWVKVFCLEAGNYHVVAQAQIRMILIYRKGIKDDLTPKEKAILRKINAEW